MSQKAEAEDLSFSNYYDFVQSCHEELERETLITAFAKQGGAGAKFKAHVEKLTKCLNLPKGAREDLGMGEEGLVYD